jgi:hypothetical protein
MPEEQRDLIDAAKSRDQRIALIEQSLDIEVELRDSPTWRYIRHRIEGEKAEICAALAEMADRGELNKLQARAMAAVFIPHWLSELIGASRAAEEQIAVEDGRAPRDE